MPFCADDMGLRQATSFRVRGHSCFPTRNRTPIRRWIEAQRQQLDPELVELVKAAAKDNQRRELGGRFGVQPYPGRQHANEASTVTAALHRTAQAADVKIAVRKFDRTKDGVRLTFRVQDAK